MGNKNAKQVGLVDTVSVKFFYTRSINNEMFVFPNPALLNSNVQDITMRITDISPPHI